MFAGGYRLDAELGRGATGTVYRARHPDDDRVAAVKVLDPALAADADMRDRLAHEADAMATVAHANCVAVYDHGDDEAGAWIAMEYIHGATLRAVLAAAGRLSPAQACGVLSGALAGLGHAHSVGVIHRDLKPDNILVDASGVSKLTDFGLVARRDDPDHWRPLEGSPAYMSPEQVRGEPLDPRSDLYAAGAVLYELLTGHPPFAAETPVALLHAQVAAPIPPTEDLPSAIGRLVRRALAKNPNDRPADAEEFADALQQAARRDLGTAWLAGAGIAGLVVGILGAEAADASTVGATHRLTRRPRSRTLRSSLQRAARSKAIILASTATIVAGVATVVVVRSGPSSAPRHAAPAVGSPCRAAGPGAPSVDISSTFNGRPRLTISRFSGPGYVIDQPVAAGPPPDRPGSAVDCIWVGTRTPPVVPYFFPYDVSVTVSIVTYQSAELAKNTYYDGGPASSLAAGLPQITGVGDAAYLGAAPQDGNASLVVLYKQYVFSVKTQATGTFLHTNPTPWITIGRAVVAEL